ncbi:MAG: hypothetical protein Q9225_007878, partial [Loekoesia sp. 1 TL-2023]
MAAVEHEHKEPFHYEGLSNPQNIRLLQLLPAGSQADEVRCSIDQAYLNGEIQYEALSYTWGDATQRSELYCNGKTLSITPNLGVALRHLRPRTGSRTLWIDAVCINQANNEEKSQQIALMGEIYARAHQVIAWIGEENPADSAAMEYGDPDPLPDHSSAVERVVKLLSLQGKLSGSLMCATKLIQRPWFSRAWIIQEAALAARLQVQCGEKTIDWESLYANLRLMTQTNDANGASTTFNNNFYRRLEFIESTRNNVRAARSGKETSRTQEREERPTDRALSWKKFHSAVNNGRLYGASDQRDHIYPLLGLISKDRAQILPLDYSLSYACIYRAFVQQIIQQTGSLTILGQIDSLTTTGLESWVPNYSRASMVEPLCSDDEAFYTASGVSEARLVDSTDAFVLAPSGIFIDTIDEVAVGPSTEKEKVFGRSEMLIHETADKVHPTEILPKLAYKAVSHYFPRVKEVIDDLQKARPELDYSGEHEAVNQAVADGPNRFYKRAVDLHAHLPSAFKGGNNEALAKQTFDLFGSYIRDMRPVRQDYLFGPMHPINDVYMKPALEEQWQRLAQKCEPYPTGEHIEEAYWRTLIGNKRSDFTGALDKPPAFWKGAYRVWHEQLWEKEGLIPRFLNGRGLRTKEGLQPISEDLRIYGRDVVAKQERVSLDDRLKASGMRDIASLAISFSIEDPIQDKQGKQKDANPVSEKRVAAIKSSTTEAHDSNKQLAQLVKNYPNISNDEKNYTHEIISAANIHKDIREETVRAKIDQAFKYDFLRIAKN